MKTPIKNKILGITGVARSGKDTLARCIVKAFPSVRFEVVSLAHQLKIETRQEIYERFKIDSFTSKTEEKTIIRQFLVDYAAKKRSETNGSYFTDIINSKVINLMESGVVPIISDLRYAEYQFSELQWFKSLDGFMIHVTKYYFHDNKWEILGPANVDEFNNDSIMMKNSDAHIIWQEGLSEEIILSKRYDLIADQFSKIQEYLCLM